MKPKNQWSSLVLLALGAVISLLSLRLSLGSLGHPGAGFAPFIYGLTLGGISLLNFFLGAEAEEGASSKKEGAYSRVIFAGGSLVFYALCFSILGYLLSTLLAVMGMMRLIDRVRWSIALSFSGGAAIASFLFFEYGLGVPLPPGILRWLIQ